MKSSVFIISFLLLVSVITSCSPSRRVPEGRYLLNRNSLEIEDSQVKRHELTRFYRQNPNRRILGMFRFHLHVYNLADGKRDNRVTRWMKNTIGEPPVIYDMSMSQSTRRQFELYMQSKGYFNATVEYTEKTRKNKINVNYSITGNTPYTIRDIDFNIQDPAVKDFVLNEQPGSLVRSNDQYDADNLHAERNRLARNLRDNGYFRFSRDLIFFDVDSNLNSHQVDLELRINNPISTTSAQVSSDTPERHKRFYINNVVVFPEFTPLTANIPRADTTVYYLRDRRTGNRHAFTFIHNGPLRIKPSIVANHIMIRQGDVFRVSNLEQSYTFLSEMRNFRFINLQFQETTHHGIVQPNDTIGLLNATIQLNRMASNAFTVEAEGLNTAGNLGVASNFLFQNRNVLRGAEIFNLRLKGALEVSGESGREEVIQSLPFNTLELGLEAGIDFPKLLLPLPVERLSRNSRPKSSVVAGVNFRQRPDYTRYILNLNYGFEWNETSQKRHFINPIEISSVRVFNDSILRANIPDANPFILSRFRDHFILGMKYTYVHNTQVMGRTTDFTYLRANFESAGNLLSLAAGNMNLTPDENGSYRIFNIPFSQFLKGDADYRYYRVFDERQSLVFRVMGGLGYPYGNVSVLPFIKSYYGGGANGLRAWKIYTLGPGSYPGTDEVRFDRYGDIKLELNLEYRFRIYSFWHGAFFVDAGNVWFVRRNEQFPGGEFQFSQLGNDMAIGSGMGLRLDFSFFILRIDGGFKVKDPSVPFADQWISSFPNLRRDFNINLGIGYPF